MKTGRVILACLVVWVGGASAFGQEGKSAVVIKGDVRGEMRKLRVAVPDFNAAPELKAAAAEMAQVVANDLEFTGFFTSLPRAEFPAAFTGLPADATQLDFDLWRPTRCDYLIFASVTLQGDALVAECRMFDIANGVQLVGQRFQAQKDLPRLVAHRFSEEIVRYVDGTPGIGTSRICFSGIVGNNKEIFIADYDGHNAKQVTKHNSISIKPKISPDGRKIAYVSYKDRFPFLYIFNLDTGQSTPLSKHVGLNSSPAWSPDGSTIAMTLSKDGNTEIYVKNADGSNPRRLTNDKGGDTSPSFDPSGRQIVFVSERAGTPQIHIMNADGSGVRRVSYQGGKSYDPAWSPDGRMIAYVVEKPGDGFEIYAMNVQSGDSFRLTDSAGANESPSWSADSRHIIFSSTRAGKGLYAVNIRPPFEEHRIGSGNMACEGPSWGPRRAQN